jgi:hypothetical protein
VYPDRLPLRGLVIWTSPDGERWTRQSNADLREPVSGNADVTDVTGTPVGVLVSRSSGDDGLFASPDGSGWGSMGPLPPGYRGGGSLGLVTADDRVVVSFDAEGPLPNTLEVWIRDVDGGWTRSLHEPRTTTDALVAAGQLVVTAGRSYDSVLEDWPRILVSTDGGASWDPDLSWSGARGGCTRDLATDGTRLVLFGCYDGAPTLWYADVPATAVPSPVPSPIVPTAPTARWGPMAVVHDTARDGLDAGLGPGVLTIGETCTTLEFEGRPTTLVWRDWQAAWDPHARTIRFEDRSEGEIELASGDRLMLGGYAPWTQGAGGPPAPPWLVPPDPTCPSLLFLVHSVTRE